MYTKIRLMPSQHNVRDADIRRVYIEGVVNLVVKLKSRTATLQFNVCKCLGADITVGHNYLEVNVKSSKPRKRVVKLLDGTTVIIIHQILVRHDTSLTFPTILKEERMFALCGLTSQDVVAANNVTPALIAQTWVEVITQDSGLVLIEPVQRPYTNQLSMAENGIREGNPESPTRFLWHTLANNPALFWRDNMLQLPSQIRRVSSNPVLHVPQLSAWY